MIRHCNVMPGCLPARPTLSVVLQDLWPTLQQLLCVSPMSTSGPPCSPNDNICSPCLGMAWDPSRPKYPQSGRIPNHLHASPAPSPSPTVPVGWGRGMTLPTPYPIPSVGWERCYPSQPRLLHNPQQVPSSSVMYHTVYSSTMTRVAVLGARGRN